MSSHLNHHHIHSVKSDDPEAEKHAKALFEDFKKSFKEVMNMELSGILLVASKKHVNDKKNTSYVLGLGTMSTEELVLMISDFFEVMTERFPLACRLASLLRESMVKEEMLKYLKDMLKSGATNV